MLELANTLQPILNAAVAFTAGAIGLWAAIQQKRLKRAHMGYTIIGSICLILLSPGLLLTDLEGDAVLVRALVIRLLFLGLYVSWAVKALHHLREWRRSIASLQ